MRQWVIYPSVVLTYSGFYEGYGIKTSVSLGEMKC